MCDGEKAVEVERAPATRTGRVWSLKAGLAVGASVALLAIALTACGGSGGTAGAGSAGTSGSGQPPKTPQGKIVIADVQSSRTSGWDAAGSFGGFDIRLYSMIYEALVNHNAAGKLVPALATKWQRLSPTTLRVWLRHGVKFQNGQPFTAADVKATLDRLGAKNSTVLAAVLLAPMHVNVLNPYEVDVVTDKPDGSLLDDLSFALVMSAKDLADGALKQRPNGTGAFEFVSRTNTQTILKANPNYWNASLPHIKTVVSETIPDQTARANALRTGAVDLIPEAGPLQITQFRGNSNFYIPPPREYIPGHLVYIYREAGPLANPLVRQAFAYAVNRQPIVKSALQGLEAVGYSPLPTTDTMYKPLTPRFDYNPAKARALLKQAGYPHGFTLHLATSTVFPGQQQMDLAVASYLKAVGINVVLDQLDVGTFQAGVYANPKYDMSVNTFVEASGTTDNAFVVFRQPILKAVFNSTDPKIDQLANSQREPSDPQQHQAAVDAAANYIWQQQPALFMADAYNPDIISTRVHNYVPARNFGLSQLKYAWVSAQH